jgi:uncharacterized protein (TIGR02996 family)
MTEDAFLRALQERPNDDTTRLIFADWLDEHGDEAGRARAAFIRLDTEFAALREDDPARARMGKRRRRLAEQIDAGWLAVVSKAPIELCEFAYECPLKWEELTPIGGDTTTRFCDMCQQNVYYCDTIEQARGHAYQEHCVAVDARVVRKKGDLERPRPLLMGVVAPDYFDPPQPRPRRRRRKSAE